MTDDNIALFVSANPDQRSRGCPSDNLMTNKHIAINNNTSSRTADHSNGVDVLNAKLNSVESSLRPSKTSSVTNRRNDNGGLKSVKDIPPSSATCGGVKNSAQRNITAK